MRRHDPLYQQACLRHAEPESRKRFRKPNSQVYVEFSNFQNIPTIGSSKESRQQMMLTAIVEARLE